MLKLEKNKCLFQICLEFDPIHSQVLPSLSSANSPPAQHPKSSQVICKSIWDNAVFTEDLVMTKPWQARFNLGHGRMLVSFFIYCKITTIEYIKQITRLRGLRLYNENQTYRNIMLPQI